MRLRDLFHILEEEPSNLVSEDLRIRERAEEEEEN